jgi:hypothetical protein
VPKTPTMHPCRQVGLDYLETAQVRFSNTVSISLAPDELFGVLARADTWPRWAKVITHVEYTSPAPYGVGTTRVVTMRGGMVGDEEFLAWEPGKLLAFRFNTSATSALEAFLEVYTIVPTSTGCELTWDLAQELKGPSKVLAPLSKPVMNLLFKRFLRNLQKLTADGVPAPA